MPKPKRNDCKKGKQTDSLVQGARNVAQKSQITVYTKISARVCIYNTSEWHSSLKWKQTDTNQ